MGIKSAAEHAVQTTGGVTYTAAGGAVLFGLSAAEFAAYVGAGIAILSFVANQYWQYRTYKLRQKEAAEHVHSDVK